MRNVLFYALLFSLTAASNIQAQAIGPLTFGKASVVSTGVEFGMISGGAVQPGKGAAITDMLNYNVRMLAPGKPSWVAGRQGSGPGEYRSAYRAALRPNGNVLVYDRTLQAITELSQSGTYLNRTNLPLIFQQLDQIVATDSLIIAVGVLTNAAGSMMDTGIHVFDNRLRHVRSFGQLPISRNVWVHSNWGAGSVALTDNSELVYLMRLPYRIYRYTLRGVLKDSMDAGIKIDHTPDDFFHVGEENGKYVFRLSGAELLLPGTIARISATLYLTSFGEGRKRGFVLFDMQERKTSVLRDWPAELGYPLGFDHTTGLLWLSGFKEDEPVLWTIPVQRSFPSGKGR